MPLDHLSRWWKRLIMKRSSILKNGLTIGALLLIGVVGNGVLAQDGLDDAESVRSFTRLLQDNDPKTRKLAAEELAKFGPKAKEAIPALLKRLLGKSGFDTYAIEDALVKIGPASIDPTIKAFAQAEEEQKLYCLSVLGQLYRPDHKELEAFLCLSLTGKSTDGVRICAIQAVTSYDCKVYKAIPILIGILLNSKEPDRVRHIAASAVGQFGPEPQLKVVVPELRKIAKDKSKDQYWRGVAFRSLGVLAHDDKEIFEEARKALANEMEPEFVRAGAAMAMRNSDGLQSAAPDLILALRNADKTDKDGNGAIRQNVLMVLAKVRPPVKDIPYLITLLGDDEIPHPLRNHVMTCLGNAEAAARPFAEDIVKSSIDLCICDSAECAKSFERILGRTAAIKMINEHYMSNNEFVERARDNLLFRIDR